MCCPVLVDFVCTIHLQVARAGRFGTKGLAITFVSDESDARVLNSVQDRFEVNITELPEEIDATTYSELLLPTVFQLMHTTIGAACIRNC